MAVFGLSQGVVQSLRTTVNDEVGKRSYYGMK
jgi:hypothetical protein